MDLEKGDLVEYKSPRTGYIGIGIIDGTEEDWWMIKGYVSIKTHILNISCISRIITKGLVPKKAFIDFDGLKE